MRSPTRMRWLAQRTSSRRTTCASLPPRCRMPFTSAHCKWDRRVGASQSATAWLFISSKYRGYGCGTGPLRKAFRPPSRSPLDCRHWWSTKQWSARSVGSAGADVARQAEGMPVDRHTPPRRICLGIGSPLATSALGPFSPLAHLRWDVPRDWTQSCSHVQLGWAGPCHICAGTERRRAPSANPRVCAQDARRLVIAVRGTASVSDVSALYAACARLRTSGSMSVGVLTRASVLRSVSGCGWAHPCSHSDWDWAHPRPHLHWDRARRC